MLEIKEINQMKKEIMEYLYSDLHQLNEMNNWSVLQGEGQNSYITILRELTEKYHPQKEEIDGKLGAST